MSSPVTEGLRLVGLRVLVVEDDDVLRETLSECLGIEGAAVLGARTGK
jgi:CheY-like chemotaxis protein